MNARALADAEERTGDSVGPPDAALDLRDTEIELFSMAGHDGLLREVNNAFALLIGSTADEIKGRSLLELVHPNDVPQVVRALSLLQAGTAEVLLDTQFPQRSGSPVHLEWVARPVAGTDLWWASGRDTSAFHRALDQSIELQARLELAIGDVTAGMWDLDLPSGRFTWEQQALTVLGIEAVGEVGGPQTAEALVELVHPEDRLHLAAALADLSTSDGAVADVVRIGNGASMRYVALRGKTLVRNRRGKPQHIVGLVLDISAEKALEEQMLRMAMSDGLTGVPNRRAFDQTLRAQVRKCQRDELPISVLMIDIDHFKHFNDTYGHLVGDDALCFVARKLNEHLGESGFLARFGGEEFSVVLANTSVDEATRVGTRLVEAIRTVTLRQAPDTMITVSIGVAGWASGEPAVKAAELLRRADSALYDAKAAGRNVALRYDTSSPPIA